MAESEIAAAPSERLKVFVSYSRTDLDFSDQLILALEDKGFEALVDRHDIDAAEKWKDRLGTLIASCDTVVFVLSEKSAGSPICGWEVEEAARLGKRIIPVVPHDPSGVAPPPQLGELNYIHFFKHPNVPGSGFYDGVQKLDRALKVNLGWLRRQTAYAEQAAGWAADKSDDRVLGGKPLEEAIAWRTAAPKGQIVTPLVLDYLAAGEAVAVRRKAEADANIAERESALKSAQRATTIGFLVAIALIGLAGFLTFTAARATHLAGVNRAEIFAGEADHRMSDAHYAEAALIALAGDPSARRGGWIERIFFAREGYPSVAGGLVLALAQNRLLHTISPPAQDHSVIAFAQDGSLAAVFDDGEVRLWNTDGAELGHFSVDSLLSHQFSSDGRRLLVGAADGYRVWDVQQRQIVHTLTRAQVPGSGIFSPDGARILVENTSAKMVDVATGRTLWTVTPPRAGDSLWQSEFAQDGQRLLLSFQHEIDLVNAETGAVLWRYTTPEGAAADVVALSPTGRRAMLAFGPRAYVVDTASNASMLLEYYVAQEFAVFATDDRVLTTSAGGAVAVRDAARQWRPVPAFTETSGAVVELAISPDHRSALTTGRDGAIRLWSLAEPASQRVPTPEAGLPVSLYNGPNIEGHVAFSPDGTRELWARARTIPGALPDRTIALVDARTRRAIHVLSDDYDSSNIAYAPDGDRVAGTPREGHVTVWNAQTGAVAKEVQFPDPVRELVFTPDGRGMLVGTMTGAFLWLFDGDAPQPIGPRVATYSAAFSPDGRRVLIGDMEGAVLYEVSTRRPARRFLDSAGISVALSRDGRFALAGDNVGQAGIWDIETGRLIQVVWTTQELVTALAFSSDGRSFLTAGPNGFVERWAVDPLIFQSSDDRVRAACVALRRIGMTRYSDYDLDRFPILRNEPPDACEGIGGR